MKDRILVLGATGAIGGMVAERLRAAGYAVRGLSSKPHAADGSSVEWVQADLASGRGLDLAFEGVQRAFIFAPPGFANQDAILRPVIAQAVRAELDKVVLMTAMGADAVESAPLRQAEIALERSGLTWNIVRPNWFMQNFNTFWLGPILGEGKILLPAGRAPVSFIDTRDIADVVERLLTRNDKDNQAFDLSGHRAIDHHEAAAMLSGASGRRIVYEEIAPEAMKQAFLQAGLNEPYADFLMLILGFLAQGYNARTTDNVRALLGRKPRDFESYARDHAAAWKA